MTELFLPITPPSANKLWTIARGRLVKSNEYAKWLRDMGYVVNSQHPDLIDRPYHLRILARRPNSLFDVDNIIKPTSDLLQKMGAVKNDRYCEMVSARWVTSGYDGLAIQIEPAGME